MERKQIKDCVKLSMGVILKRKITEDDNSENAIKVCRPGLFTNYGKISKELLEEAKTEKFTEPFGENDKNRKITKPGDIILRLCAPYSAIMIDNESKGLVIPSFCALVENTGDLDSQYLLAFFNSSSYREAINNNMSERASAVSIRIIGDIEIPLPSKDEQRKIGKQYMQSMEKLEQIDKIYKLEKMRNDCIFEELNKR